MPILSDSHLHSSFSGDSDCPMEDMVLRAVSLGLKTLCFTEHNDFDFPDSPDLPGSAFVPDTDACLRELSRLREKYSRKIRLLFGIELGLQAKLSDRNAAYASSHSFDFIIGSTHVCRGMDPYYPAFFEGRDEEAALGEYFETTLENLRTFSDYDVCGHLDYAVRYAPQKDRFYSYEKYRELLDEILSLLVRQGKGLELNTGGIRSGMSDFHPSAAILSRYRELGGEIVTVGSDSHDDKNIAAHFDLAARRLASCGFRYYCTFAERKPEFHRL